MSGKIPIGPLPLLSRSKSPDRSARATTAGEGGVWPKCSVSQSVTSQSQNFLVPTRKKDLDPSPDRSGDTQQEEKFDQSVE